MEGLSGFADLGLLLKENVERKRELPHIKIKSIDLSDMNASIKFKNAHKISELKDVNIHMRSFDLKNSVFDENHLLHSKVVKGNFGNATFHLPSIQHEVVVSSLQFNSYSKYLTFSELEIHPEVYDSTKLKFVSNSSISGLRFTGYKIPENNELKELRWNELTARRININHEVLQKSSSTTNLDSILKHLQTVDLKQIELAEVDVLVRDSTSTLIRLKDGYLISESIKGNSADSNKLMELELAGLEYGGKKLRVPFKNINHYLELQSFDRTRDSTLTIKNLSFRPQIGQQIADSAFSGVILIPEMRVNEVHTLGSLTNERLDLGEITIQNPVVRLKLKKPNSNSNGVNLESKLKYNPERSLFRSINSGALNIVDGDIQVKTDSIAFAVREFNLKSNNWEISDTSTWQESKFLWADDFSLSLAKFDYTIPGVDFCHNVDSITYDFDDNNFAVHGIYYNNEGLQNFPAKDHFSLFLDKVQVKEFDLPKLLDDSALVIGDIEIVGGLFEGDLVTRNHNDSNKSLNFLPNQIPENILGLNRLQIHKAHVGRMDAEFNFHGEKNTAPLNVHEFNLEIDSFDISPGQLVDSNRLFWARDIILDIDNIYTTLDDGLYEFGADKLHASSYDDSIGMSKISFSPTVYMYEYALYKDFRKDVFHIKSNSLGISDINLFDVVYKKDVVAHTLDLNKTNLHVLKDKRIPELPNQYKSVFPEMFKSLPINVTFDSVMVNNLKILYEEFPEVGREPGKLRLSEMYIVAKNVTNDTARLLEDSLFVIDMSTKFLEQSDLVFHIEYNMLSPQNQFTMFTTLDSLDATAINPYIENTLNARIDRAMVQGMNMYAIGNDSLAGGKMSLFYEDLKFTILNEQDLDDKNSAKSMLGNFFVSSNNKYNPFKRMKPLFFVRDTTKGWIGYLIKIELSGVQSAAGFKRHKNVKEIKRVDKALWKEINKDEKESRKQLRKELKRQKKELKD